MPSSSAISPSKARNGARKGSNTPEALLALYRQMLLIRRTEERLSQLFADGEVPGFIHLSIGQEAIAAGLGSVLERRDTIASTHRGHGHALAKGVELNGFFQEVMGRETGVCKGRGGSMHVADMSAGMLGANGIVGAGMPIAVGSALAHQVRKTGGVGVVFFGDGALAEGVLHESLNLSALWKLPVLFVCENNGWSEFSPTSKQFVAPLAKLADAFGILAETIDGNDVEIVAETAGRLVTEIRKGGGPRVLECITQRVRGHYEGDAQKYRDPAELHDRDRLDPLQRATRRLVSLGVEQAMLLRIESDIMAEIDAATAAARAAPLPVFAAAQADVYTPAGA